MALIYHYSRDFSTATQGLNDLMAADDPMAWRYEQMLSIRYKSLGIEDLMIQ